jgi:hypothetical protein
MLAAGDEALMVAVAGLQLEMKHLPWCFVLHVVSHNMRHCAIAGQAAACGPWTTAEGPAGCAGCLGTKVSSTKAISMSVSAALKQLSQLQSRA